MATGTDQDGSIVAGSLPKRQHGWQIIPAHTVIFAAAIGGMPTAYEFHEKPYNGRQAKEKQYG